MKQLEHTLEELEKELAKDFKKSIGV